MGARSAIKPVDASFVDHHSLALDGFKRKERPFLSIYIISRIDVVSKINLPRQGHHRGLSPCSHTCCICPAVL